MKRAREESPDNLPDQDQNILENDEVRIAWFFNPGRLYNNISQGFVQYLLDLFQSLPRKQLEKEVAKSKSSGESQEELINRLLDQNPPIDLTCLEEEEEVGAAELVETPEPGQ